MSSIDSRKPSSQVSRVTEVMATQTPPTRGPMRNRLILMPEHPERVDPQIAIVEDWFRVPGGFPTHPHRGFETVTLVLDGEVAHEDTIGHRALLKPGDVQWMTAGCGVRGATRRDAARRRRNARPATVAEPVGGGEARGAPLPRAARERHPRRRATRCLSPRRLGRGRWYPRAGREHRAGDLSRRLDGSGHARCVAAPRGPSRRGVRSLRRSYARRAAGASKRGRSALLSSGAQVEISLTAASRSRLILIAGRPIGEPVVTRGPFVMNSEEEIVQAYADLRSGRFTTG